MSHARSRLRAPALLAVAALLLAACGNGDEEAVDVPVTDADIAVVGQDNLQWHTEHLEAEAGEITLALACQGGVNHNFVVDETGEEIAECAPGETVETEFELEAGDYTYVCTIPGHERSMRGQLTVE